MNEQMQITKEQLTKGTMVMLGLTLGTFSAGFTLICLEYISPIHFFAGVASGVAATASIGTIAACAMRDRFFKPAPMTEEMKLVSDNMPDIEMGKVSA